MQWLQLRFDCNSITLQLCLRPHGAIKIQLLLFLSPSSVVVLVLAVIKLSQSMVRRLFIGQSVFGLQHAALKPKNIGQRPLLERFIYSVFCGRHGKLQERLPTADEAKTK